MAQCKTYRQKIFGLLIVIMMLDSCVTQKIELGSIYVKERSNERIGIFMPSGDLINCERVHYGGIEYDLVISPDGRIKYISTNDENFEVNGLKVGYTISQIDKINPIEEKMGWGYYMKIDEKWYAGFDFNESPTKNSPILWFFQYDFGN